jgi:hypothetical protein
MEAYYWLSFVDPKPDQFLGVCIVEANDIVLASQVAHLLGCNPGGSVAGFPLHGKIPDEYLNRLFVTKGDAERLGDEVEHYVEFPK